METEARGEEPSLRSADLITAPQPLTRTPAWVKCLSVNGRAISEVEGEAAGRSCFALTIHVNTRGNRRKDKVVFLTIFFCLQETYDQCKTL